MWARRPGSLVENSGVNLMFQRLIVGAICSFLILSTLIGESVEATKRLKAKNDKALPAGRAVLWREPRDISGRNLYLGPGGETMKPDLRHVTLIEKEKGGYSVKYRVRDASGNEWVAKLGKEAQSETAAAHDVGNWI